MARCPDRLHGQFQKSLYKTSRTCIRRFLGADSTTELHHFIGKDILYFHALFWPALLHGANFRTPTRIHTHGFVTINNQKMSKSRGTFIQVRTYLQHLPPEYLRYYFASKLNDSVEDLDISLEDFVQKNNSDLVGKLVNIASRAARLLEQHFGGQLAATCSSPELFRKNCFRC